MSAAEPRVLVYTRNGKGYVHDNIATSVEMIRELGAKHGFAVDHSDDAAIFTPEKLKPYRAVIFSNSNNEAFTDDSQREAFRSYMQAGGGLVGIHIATGSERNWPYFQSVMGGRFVRHPKLQSFTIQVKNRKHPSTRKMPATFEWTDECYFFDNVSPSIQPLLVTDLSKIDDPKKTEYPGDRFGNEVPLAWFQAVEGGRQFYTSLGHRRESYADPMFRQHVLGGILWVLGISK